MKIRLKREKPARIVFFLCRGSKKQHAYKLCQVIVERARRWWWIRFIYSLYFNVFLLFPQVVCTQRRIELSPQAVNSNSRRSSSTRTLRQQNLALRFSSPLNSLSIYPSVQMFLSPYSYPPWGARKIFKVIRSFSVIWRIQRRWDASNCLRVRVFFCLDLFFISTIKSEQTTRIKWNCFDSIAWHS